MGCAGVLTLPPFYYKQLVDDGLFRYFASLIEGVSDNRLRLYLYHIPPIAIVHFTFPLIERLIAGYPGVVVGIKDSSGDWEHTKRLVERFAKSGFDVFPGNESTLLAGLRIGAAGCISGIANVSAPALQTIFRDWQKVEAEERQTVVNRVRQVFLEYPLIPALKAVVSRMRGDPAWRSVQPPLLPLQESELEVLFQKLNAAGFRWPASSGGDIV